MFMCLQLAAMDKEEREALIYAMKKGRRNAVLPESLRVASNFYREEERAKEVRPRQPFRTQPPTITTTTSTLAVVRRL